MRRILDDIYNRVFWTKCVRLDRIFTISKSVSGAVYLNQRDMVNCKADVNTPCVVKDETGVIWTESIESVLNNYVMLDGSKLTKRYIYDLPILTDIQVRANTIDNLYAFHVYTDTYGYNCVAGVNTPGIYNDGGDYLVTNSLENLSLSTVRPVKAETFKFLYRLREDSMNKFERRDSTWFWRDVEYRDCDSAMKAMCEDIVMDKGMLIPTFGDLGNDVSPKLFLLYAIYSLDMETLMQCSNLADYERITGQKIKVHANQLNVLYGKRYRKPMAYMSNRPFQCALFPYLEEVYNDGKAMINMSDGSFPYEVVLSYLCDKLLFTLGDSPFNKYVNMFAIFDTDPRTEGLCDRAQHRDIQRLEILAMQISANDLSETDNSIITIGDVRKCKYPSKTRDILGDVDYADKLLCSPPALYDSDYVIWRNRVFSIYNKVKDVEEIPMDMAHIDIDVKIPDPEPIENFSKYMNKPEPDDSFAAYMNPPELEEEDKDDEAMHNVAEVYCNISNSDFDTCCNVLRGMGSDTWEKIYRALPIYLRRIGKGVDVSVLIEYCKILGDLYGTCDLEFNG